MNWNSWLLSAMREDPIKEEPRIRKIDLNNYRCPCCTSPFFKVGMDSYFGFVECLKPNCRHRDLLESKTPTLHLPKRTDDED